jgi:hypothetical protein
MATKRTPAQILLGLHLKELGFTGIEYEYRANPNRRWKWDLAIPGDRLLFECDGMFRGGHARYRDLADEYEKQNWATLNGWRCFRFLNVTVLRGLAKEFLRGGAGGMSR